MKCNGAELILKALVDEGVDTIFGYPGGAVLPLYDEIFKQNKIRHILVRHEQAAAHAAEAYARSTGKVGVILVTSGPGATNAVTGLTDALLDSIPVVCLTGQVPTHLIGSDAFQEADTVGITRACTKHNYLVKHIEDLQNTVAEAFYIARTGRPGPVVVDLPKSIQLQDYSYSKEKQPRRASYRPARYADAGAITEAVKLIASAKKPVFYTGGGVINAGDEASELLTKFVKKTGYPITNTLMGLGSFPASNKQFLGMLGMHGTYEANNAMHDCDVMICIGARFDDRITGRIDAFSPNSKKIHVDIDSSSINKNIAADIPLVGDAGLVLQQMLDEWDKQKPKQNKEALSKWWEEIEVWRTRKSLAYEQKGKIIKPQYALDRLNDLVKGKDAFITTDVGQHQMWAAQYLDFEKPRRWMTSGGLGTMGYGLPAAVGASVADPKRLVICVTGEASIMMNIQELSTLAQYRLPVKIFIMNNRYMGMVRQWQELFHGDRHSESYMESLPDFSALGEAFGIKGMRCDDPTKVDAAIEEMLSIDGPVIMDMQVDQNENVYPMIPAGAAHNEMKLSPYDGQKFTVDADEAKMQV
jgi:acetolactate synthase-1/2/3 large subunit